MLMQHDGVDQPCLSMATSSVLYRSVSVPVVLQRGSIFPLRPLGRLLLGFARDALWSVKYI